MSTVSGPGATSRGALLLEDVFALDDSTGTLQAVRKAKQHLRSCYAPEPGKKPPQPRTYSRNGEGIRTAETNRLYRTVCRWWKDIEVPAATAAPPMTKQLFS
jgi:transposase